MRPARVVVIVFDRTQVIADERRQCDAVRIDGRGRRFGARSSERSWGNRDESKDRRRTAGGRQPITAPACSCRSHP